MSNDTRTWLSITILFRRRSRSHWIHCRIGPWSLTDNIHVRKRRLTNVSKESHSLTWAANSAAEMDRQIIGILNETHLSSTYSSQKMNRQMFEALSAWWSNQYITLLGCLYTESAPNLWWLNICIQFTSFTTAGISSVMTLHVCMDSTKVVLDNLRSIITTI